MNSLKYSFISWRHRANEAEKSEEPEDWWIIKQIEFTVSPGLSGHLLRKSDSCPEYWNGHILGGVSPQNLKSQNRTPWKTAPFWWDWSYPVQRHQLHLVVTLQRDVLMVHPYLCSLTPDLQLKSDSSMPWNQNQTWEEQAGIPKASQDYGKIFWHC